MMVPLHLRETHISEIAADVQEGLTAFPKRLPPRLFYDAQGSRLFEEITRLPEYYLTRTERAILEEKASEIIQQAGEGLTLIELGAGTAAKTGVLIAALLRRQLSATYYPIDVSAEALRVADQNLSRNFPRLKVLPQLGDYSHGMAQLSKIKGRKLVLYIGSSIGNFEPPEAGELLRSVRQSLQPGDALLLGTDMVKLAAILRTAYDDSDGVTAAFNRNVLRRINRELGADFDLSAFRHMATWNSGESRIEMHLQSLRRQSVWVDDLALEVEFEAGETIHTENSYKFTPALVESILEMGGFLRESTWSDPRGWFTLHLARVPQA